MLELNTNEFKDETEEQKKIRLKKRDDNYCKNNNLYTIEMIENLSLENHIQIFVNTVKKIRKYYKNIKIDIVVYDIDCKEIDKRFKDCIKKDNNKPARLLKNLLKNQTIRFMYLSKIKQDKTNHYYYDMYYFFVNYGNFYKRYTDNMVQMGIFKNIIKNDPNIIKHFDKSLNKIITFHSKIEKKHLAQYFCYYETQTTNKDFYKLFNSLLRIEIRKITIDTTLQNPYIKF